jgi:hypothetical protein
MEQVTYKRYTVLGISDCTECDKCGKTNLKLTIELQDADSGEVVRYGSDCAATSLKQRYMGKRYPVSREAALSMARRAKTEKVQLEAA